jgi:anti-sigma B factor antagonist
MPIENIQIVTTVGARHGHKVLALTGTLNIHTIFDFQNAVRADASPALIVDFSGVPYMDSAGLGAVIGAHVAAQRTQRRIAFAGMNERLNTLIEMSHLGQVLRIYPTVAEAETALG